MDRFRQDLVYAIRQLDRAPGFAAVAILTLGVAIGANTAIFSIVDSILLQPLPMRTPTRSCGSSRTCRPKSPSAPRRNERRA